jgi:2-hydroxychromene-2-carboxylate isomerase
MNNPEKPRGVLYVDIISPWASLFDFALRKEPLSIELELRPVLFAGLLNTFGHKGPVEIERKRRLTYELCTWTARQAGMPFIMPSVHPFNPLRYLRLILVLGSKPEVVSHVFDQLFTTGCDPDSEPAWLELHRRIGVAPGSLDVDAPEVKARLRNNTTAAAEEGVFGVPTVTVGDRLFWGFDSLPMLRAYLRGDPEFGSPAMLAASRVRFGAQR